MKKKILICLITLSIILAVIGTVFLLKKDDKNITSYIANVTKNAKIIDKNTDHNQALDVIEFAQKQGIKPPSILINFDTHSDIYVNRKISSTKGAQIEDWINEYIAKNNNVNTVYWVMPKEEALNIFLRFDFGTFKEKDLTWGSPLLGNSLKPLNLRFLFIPLTFKAYKQETLINPEYAILNEYAKGYRYNNIIFDKKTKFKKVTIITCTENTLPDFENKDVFLSIDADYISNSGFDTANDFVIKKTPKGIEKTFSSIMKTLDKKHIRPSIISMTLSPEYLPAQHHAQVLDLFEQVLIIAKQPDALLTYTRFNNHDYSEEGGKSLKKQQN